MSGPFTGATGVDAAATVHGGDVDEVSREFGIPVADLLDFSANINPAGPPASVLERLARDASDPRLLARYPDPIYAELREALARHLDVPSASLTIANGSAALFGAVIRASTAATCLITVPAFGEQLRALAATRCAIVPFRLEESAGFLPDLDGLCRIIDTRAPGLCLLTNPHNPSGALMTRAAVAQVVRTVERTGTRLVVDEAFIEYSPAGSVVDEVTRSRHLVVLRSLTKFYGMPALRVGYAVSAPGVAADIGAQLPHWPVTTLAVHAAATALADLEYARDSLAAVAVERAWLGAGITSAGLHTYPSGGNFLLVRLPQDGPNSAQLRTELIRTHRLIVRDCRSFDGMEDGRFIRVAVLTRADNTRLLHALRATIGTRDADGF